MADLMLTCDFCRHRMRVSEFQLGMEVVCPNCKAELTVSEGNTIPLEVKEPAVEYEPFAAKTKDERSAQEHGTERCERCDAVIRGDWDRYETDAGTWCHRCVNRVRTDDEDEVRVLRRGGAEAAAAATAVTGGLGPEYVMPDGVMDQPLTREDIIRQHTERARAEWEAKQPKDDRPAFMRDYPRAWRAVLWSLVAFVFLSTAYYFFIVPESGTRVIEEDIRIAETIRQAPLGIRISLSLSFWLLASVVPLYATLYMAEKLPTGAVIPDAIHVTAMSILLAVLALGTTIFPLVGHLVYMVLAILILWSVYEMNFSDFITWMLFTFLLRYLVLMPLESRVLYSVAQWAG